MLLKGALFLVWSLQVVAFAPPFSTKRSKILLEAKKSRQSQKDTATLPQEDEPAGVVGAEFFGGNKQKEELYDPQAEAQADKDTKVTGVYNRFEDLNAFDCEETARVAKSIQLMINSVLYSNDDDSEEVDISYASNTQWDTPFEGGKSGLSPLQELEKAMDFYERIDVAVVSGSQQAENTFQINWEISVAWPTFWEPRVLISGSSTITIDNGRIVRQVDSLEGKDLFGVLAGQVLPRFWDVYHIGMTPSAEIMPRKKTGGRGYSLYEIGPRLMLTPKLTDVGSREDSNAQTIPNHAFSCVIKTMGPQKQRFVPTSPIQVQIQTAGRDQPLLKWSIPLSVEFLSNIQLPLPDDDPEKEPGSNPECEYELQPCRRFATVSYGGNPQDKEIADLRRRLYESVVRDGLSPVLDEAGRPQFFFLQNGAKACYTDGGLGMAVYEWRPQFVKPNEVGIELEF